MYRFLSRLTVKLIISAVFISGCITAHAEQSVQPGINEHYKNADVDVWVQRFENDHREVYAKRTEILKATDIATNESVADIGAGTGIFTKLFADAVGSQGKVYAVDITPEFVHKIESDAKRLKRNNIVGIINTDHTVGLPTGSIDLAFVCNTYHHFEYPQAMLQSIHGALRDNGRLIIIDYQKLAGIASPWVMTHVRVGKAEVITEIEANGFQLLSDKPVLQQNYFLQFKKLTAK